MAIGPPATELLNSTDGFSDFSSSGNASCVRWNADWRFVVMSLWNSSPVKSTVGFLMLNPTLLTTRQSSSSIVIGIMKLLASCAALLALLACGSPRMFSFPPNAAFTLSIRLTRSDSTETSATQPWKAPGWTVKIALPWRVVMAREAMQHCGGYRRHPPALGDPERPMPSEQRQGPRRSWRR